MKSVLKAALLGAVALMCTAANTNWNTSVTLTEGGHLIGNPDAKLKITEFISYTCPHCANFAREGEAPLQLAYVGPGRANLEIRHLILNQVDLAAAMLTWCGDKSRFPANHAAFMYRQDEWLGEARKTSAAQRSRWQNQDLRTRNRAIADDLGFYRIMEGRGYSRIETETCLADAAMADQLMLNTQLNGEVHGVRATPSFQVNGKLQDAVHEWSTLEPVLGAALREIAAD
ncbi:DsbA family protein [Altererythrobacter aquiaggeris]|uniref:DsbA family protein n=1 Tax=Aestuarierythrobacter aquiaggeris TaxID=1898396 RepID=UPI00301A1F0B